jgi:hypothetical protein
MRDAEARVPPCLPACSSIHVAKPVRPSRVLALMLLPHPTSVLLPPVMQCALLPVGYAPGPAAGCCPAAPDAATARLL